MPPSPYAHQLDATALATSLALERLAPPGVSPAGACTLGLTLSADDAATALWEGGSSSGQTSQAGQPASQSGQTAGQSCVPGLWRLLEGCEHPKVSAALLAAAAHVAPLCPLAQPQLQQGQVPALPRPEEAAAASPWYEVGGGGCEVAVAVAGTAAWLALQLISAAGAFMLAAVTLIH